METRKSETLVLLRTVYFIYFFCGLAQCFETVFIPEFKEYFHLGYRQAMYVNTGKSITLILSVAVGLLARRIGFKNCLTVALFLYTGGTLLILPSLQWVSYGLLIGAFTVIGLGFSFQLVAGNPLLSNLGDPKESSSRLNLGNALGAVAWVLSPLIIWAIIPGDITRAADKIPYMQAMFFVIFAVLAVTAVYTIFLRETDCMDGAETGDGSSGATQSSRRMVWLNPKVLAGFAAIFLALGVEAGVFSLIQNYLADPSIAAVPSQYLKPLFTVFFVLFACGRMAASRLQKRINPAANLVLYAGIAIGLIVLITTTTGWAAAASIVILGFFISIFFPTLYALAIEGLGPYTAQASGLLTVGFLGGAVLPVVQGALADWPAVGLQKSFALAILPYGFVIWYALNGHKWGQAQPETLPVQKEP